MSGRDVDTLSSLAAVVSLQNMTAEEHDGQRNR